MGTCRRFWVRFGVTFFGALWLFAEQALAAEFVVRYRSWSDGVSMVDRVTEVRLHQDGTLIVHRPAWMREPGDFSLRLNRMQHETLLRNIDVARLLRTDSARLMASVANDDHAQRAASGVVYEASEFVVSVFDVHGSEVGQLTNVTIENLQLDAERKPHLIDLVDLAQTEQALRAWLFHPGLKRIAAPSADEVQR
jgi:hypothetical protein